ncbi:hypothetical protein ACLESO_07095 [Pyxidicoccus sp. 3LG]
MLTHQQGWLLALGVLPAQGCLPAPVDVTVPRDGAGPVRWYVEARGQDGSGLLSGRARTQAGWATALFIGGGAAALGGGSLLTW